MKAVNILKPGNNKNQAVILFFISFLILGLFIFSDYGLSWDEGSQRNIGIMNIEYALNKSGALADHQDRYHGGVFESILIFTEKIFHLHDSKSIYLGRHLLTFLTFYLGVFFFYLLCKHCFKSWKIGILGSLFLILSPRIFADSFFNSKDIPFMSVFIISVYVLVKYLESKTGLWIFFHSLISAILFDIRVLGILVPFFTLLFTITDSYRAHKMKKNISSLVFYFLLLAVFIVLFWPVLWKNPLQNFLQAFIQMSHYPWNGTVLFLGEYISAGSLPWGYVPVWISITTPILYLFGFVFGFFIFSIEIFNATYEKKRQALIFLLWFFLPIIIVILLHSILLDGWRHLFFIYPAFLVISLKGFTEIWTHIILLKKTKVRSILLALFVLIITLSLLSTACFMVINHPHQNVYFNFLVGKNARNNFELDYWGISYRQALEYILEKHPKGVINFTATNWPGEFNLQILDSTERSRLRYSSEADATYFLTNFRWHKEDYPYTEVYNITAYGSKIMSVYKLK